MHTKVMTKPLVRLIFDGIRIVAVINVDRNILNKLNNRNIILCNQITVGKQLLCLFHAINVNH